MPDTSSPYSLRPQVQELLVNVPLQSIVGFDEAGRGPLAGPVLAGAVMFTSVLLPNGLADSKKLSEKKREKLFDLIIASSFWGLGWVWPDEIEALNIHYASLEAMNRAWVDLLQRWPLAANKVHSGISDGKFVPNPGFPVLAQVKGDALIPQVSAASILAKVTRDRYMVQQDALYPAYGFAQHKGYPSLAHRQALRINGSCPIHRASWVSKILL